MGTLILVADDDAGVRRLLREVLQDDGYDVIEARDGADALDRLREATPDVLLLDVMMPRLSGWDVLDRLKRMHLDLPVGIITAAQDSSVEADRAGVAARLLKPFTVDAVLSTVERLVSPAGSAGHP